MKFVYSILSLFLLLTACRKDNFYDNSDARLSFSLDTVQFDTVFTNMGSATLWFKVYNNYNQSINISRIALAGGSASDFHINIDGQSSPLSENVSLKPNDSLYIFATVRIDPSNGDAVREDSIIFTINGNQQRVLLQAYGWNADYIGRIGDTTIYENQNITWGGSRPIVLFGWHVFENSTLNIQAGTKIYMYGGPINRPFGRASIYIGNNSTINTGAGGSINNLVEIRSHRLEEDFEAFPFHHDGIYLSRFSINNSIQNTLISNATDAIKVDSLSANGNTKLTLSNVIIYNVERAGILARTGNISAQNCLIANSNQYGIVCIKGGEYNFQHCTFANYATTSFLSRKEPICSLRDYEIIEDEQGNRTSFTAPLNLLIENSIIYGNRSEEIEVLRDAFQPTSSNIAFNTCLIKKDTFSRHLNNCIFNQNPLFKDVDEYDYSLESANSPAANAGNPSSVTRDILGNSRDAQPDLGAYEFQ